MRANEIIPTITVTKRFLEIIALIKVGKDARRFSRLARNWSVWGIVLTALFYIAYIILIAAGVSWAMWWEDADTFYTCLL